MIELNELKCHQEGALGASPELSRSVLGRRRSSLRRTCVVLERAGTE